MEIIIIINPGTTLRRARAPSRNVALSSSSSPPPPPSGGGAADYYRGRIATTAIADQSGYRAASVTVVVRYRSYCNNIPSFVTAAAAPCRDVVVNPIIRRSRVSEINTPRRLCPHTISSVSRTGERCCLAIRFAWTATGATVRRPPNARWPFCRCACTTGPTWTCPTITRAGRRRRPAVSPRPVRPRPPRRPPGRGETRPTCTGGRAPDGVPCEGRTLRHRPKYVPVNRIILYSVGVWIYLIFRRCRVKKW